MSWKLTVVLELWNVMETYGRIELVECHGNLQSYWTTEMSWNLQSYWTTEMSWKLTVVLDY
jgi:hypothetical protein